MKTAIIIDREGQMWREIAVGAYEPIDILPEDHDLYIAPSQDTEQTICDLLNAAHEIDRPDDDPARIFPSVDHPTPTVDRVKSAMGRTYESYMMYRGLLTAIAG